MNYPNLLAPLDLGFTRCAIAWSWARCIPAWKTASDPKLAAYFASARKAAWA